MAGQHVVIIQGNGGTDGSKIVALNDSSLYLWNYFAGKDFRCEDVAAALTARYGIEEETAHKDAISWCNRFRECGLLE